jgi:hypothetical protein
MESIIGIYHPSVVRFLTRKSAPRQKTKATASALRPRKGYSLGLKASAVDIPEKAPQQEHSRHSPEPSTTEHNTETAERAFSLVPVSATRAAAPTLVVPEDVSFSNLRFGHCSLGKTS